MSKFECIENELYHISAMYVEVEGKPFVMELISKLEEGTFFGFDGVQDFAQVISDYNEKLYTDPVTNVFNRRFCDECVGEIREQDAVVMLDLDNFKRVNDGYGHLIGNEVLQAVAATLSLCVRKSDAVIRYGGDEFILILRDIPRDSLHSKLERIREAICNIVIERKPDIRLSASLGSVWGKGKVTEQIEAADQFMYQAKKEKNCVYIGTVEENMKDAR